MVCADITSPPEQALHKILVSMPEFSRGNSETWSKTSDYLPKLTADGVNSDPYNLKHQQPTDIDSLPEFGFPDIHCQAS